MREEELNCLPFWEKLKKNQKEILCKGTKHLSIAKGQRLLSGSEEYGCFYIRRGSFLVLLLGETDTETELYRIKRDEICALDFLTVCGQEITDISFQAATGADIIAIEKEVFSVLMKSCYPFIELTVRGLLTSVPHLISAIEQRDYYSLEKRIINVLLNESMRQRSNTVTITHQRIAAKIGSAREVVTKKLQEFVAAEWIGCSRGKIVLLNKEKLRKKMSVGE